MKGDTDILFFEAIHDWEGLPPASEDRNQVAADMNETCFNLLGGQLFHERLPFLDEDGKEPVSALPVRILPKEGQARHAGEPRAVSVNQLPAPFIDVDQVIQLNHRHGGYNVIHVVFEPDFSDLMFFINISFAGPIHRIPTEELGPFGMGGILEGEHPSIAGSNLLDCLEREAGKVADASDRFSVVRRPEGMGRVFNDRKVMFLSDPMDFIQITRLSSPMHGKDGFRLLCDMGGDASRIDVECLFFEIGKNRFRPAIEDRNIGSGAGQGSCNDLVSLLDPRQNQG